MKGQETDPSSGVLGLLTRGQEDRRTAASAADGPTAVDLLSRPLHPAGVINLGRVAPRVGAPRPVPELPCDPPPTVVVPSGDVDIVLDPQWLADLDDPTLVISAGYVGPDRRRASRDESEHPSGGHPGGRLVRRGVLVVLMTALAVVSLVLMASQSSPPAPHAPTRATAVTGAPGTGGQRSGRPSRSATRRAARAGAVDRRSMARHRSAPDTGRALGGAASATPASAAVIRSQRVADAATVSAIRTSARAQSRVVRSMWRTVATQRRVAAVIARVERNGARRAGAKGDRSTTPPRPDLVGLGSTVEDAFGAVIGFLG